MKKLIKKLKYLNTNFNVTGVKQSFEDEGAILQDVVLMRRVTELCGLPMVVKIGGCEAKTDINNCVNMSVNGIVAPMIETEFSLQKFTESISHIKDINFYVNIESKSGYENIDNILDTPSSKLLTGVVVGRSDFTKSYGYGKQDVDSSFISEKVMDIFTKTKKYGYINLMGGNISINSVDFITKLWGENLLDYIETRNVIIKLTDDNVGKLREVIKEVILFESMWLTYKAEHYKSISRTYSDRVETLKIRLDDER